MTAISVSAETNNPRLVSLTLVESHQTCQSSVYAELNISKNTASQISNTSEATGNEIVHYTVASSIQIIGSSTGNIAKISIGEVHASTTAFVGASASLTKIIDGVEASCVSTTISESCITKNLQFIGSALATSLGNGGVVKNIAFAGNASSNVSIFADIVKPLAFAGNATVTSDAYAHAIKNMAFAGNSYLTVESSPANIIKNMAFAGNSSIYVSSNANIVKNMAFAGNSSITIIGSGAIVKNIVAVANAYINTISVIELRKALVTSIYVTANTSSNIILGKPIGTEIICGTVASPELNKISTQSGQLFQETTVIGASQILKNLDIELSNTGNIEGSIFKLWTCRNLKVTATYTKLKVNVTYVKLKVSSCIIGGS